MPKFLKIIFIVIFLLMLTAPWMNKQSVSSYVLQKYGNKDGSVDKNGNIICDYEAMWVPFGRWVASCENGYFVPFFNFKKSNDNSVEKQLFNNSDDSIKTVATETEINDWKTYRNEEYGFEFKYPENVSLPEVKGDGEPRFWVGYEKIKNKLQPDGERAESVGVFVYDNLRNLSIEDFLTYLEENENWKKWSSISQINGLSAVKIKGRPSIGIETGTSYDTTNIYLKNGFFVYNISYDRIVGLNELENVFNQILSTFKFTK